MKKIVRLFIIVLVLSLTLVGCGDKGETPEQAVTNALNAIKSLDEETANKYFAYEELMGTEDESQEIIENQENTKLLVEKISFKIISSSIDGNNATVKTEITNLDLKAIFEEYLQQAMEFALSNALAGNVATTDEELAKQMEQMLIDLIKREDNVMATSTIDIKLTKNGTSWTLDMDEPLQDAILGGLVSYMTELENSFGEISE